MLKFTRGAGEFPRQAKASAKGPDPSADPALRKGAEVPPRQGAADLTLVGSGPGGPRSARAIEAEQPPQRRANTGHYLVIII